MANRELVVLGTASQAPTRYRNHNGYLLRWDELALLFDPGEGWTYGIGIDEFVPVRSNQVPKTSSGKIQRYKLIADYQNGLFDEAVAEVKKLIKEMLGR